MRKDAKRRYHSPLRERKAAATKAAICDAAARLFVQDGYLLTSMRAVAAEAGVGERTVYAAFPTKRDLFVHCLWVATRVDDVDAATQLLRRTSDADEPTEVLAAAVDFGYDLMDRAGALIYAIVEAAASDPDLAALHVTGRDRMLESLREVTKRLDELDALADGVSPQEAADILYVLMSSHVRHLLVEHRGWTTDRYREFLHNVAASQILR
ncbi:TetR/AcrR family transcriptional regulator [Nocardioides speluncae]|uniref:TetR/AcrR family transcriptional regulator n=1 Tax=Nocardioides speluncae TaxID=2670337 RepID=UPI00137AA06A|nr:TetR/AcrR family transcriptional regulator [Nocardioides speluncae]